MSKLKIGVSGLNATDNPGPGVPVIRSLKESNILDPDIIGFAYENLEPGIFIQGLVSRTYQLPYPSSGYEILLERVFYIHNKERLDVIIPNFDAELFAFIKMEKTLRDLGINTFLPTQDQLEARQKENLHEFGEKYCFPVPYSQNVYSVNDLGNVLRSFSYPVVVKGRFYEAYVAVNLEQVYIYFHKIFEKWGVPVIIQEFVHGTEVNVVGLGDGRGNTIACVPMRKLYVTDKGKAWSGVTIEDDNLIEMTHDFVLNTKWRGPFELEIIKTVDGKYYILEINPRMPAWVYLATKAGQNIPEALVLLALGEEVKPYREYKKGLMFVRYSWDLVLEIERFKELALKGEIQYE